MSESVGRSRRIILPQRNVQATELFDKFNGSEVKQRRQPSNEGGEVLRQRRAPVGAQVVNRVSKSIDLEKPKTGVVLDAVKLFKDSDNRLSMAKSNQDFFSVGKEKGRVEGMIEGYIMAMFNVGEDLDSVSKKLVLTFNLTPSDAENHLRQFYAQRNIAFEEAR